MKTKNFALMAMTIILLGLLALPILALNMPDNYTWTGDNIYEQTVKPKAGIQVGRSTLTTIGSDGALSVGGTLSVGGGATISRIDPISLTYTDAATTTCSATLAGTVAGDTILVTANTAFSGSAYFKSAVAASGAVVLTMSADPGTTVTFKGVRIRP